LPGDACGARSIDILHEEENRMAQMAEHTECKTFYAREGVTSYLGSMDNVNWAGMVREPLEPGTQAVPEVACTVDSCRYWGRGDLCDTDEIRVSGRGAGECQDTNCQTYEKKDGE
jgi:predicted DNA-binding protein